MNATVPQIRTILLFIRSRAYNSPRFSVRNCGTLSSVPSNNIRYWRLQRGYSIAETALQSDVSPRLVTKIDADPDGYILKSDTMEKLARGLGVPAFALFFPEDIAILNHMMTKMLIRQARVFSTDSMINMFRTTPTFSGSSPQERQSHASDN